MQYKKLLMLALITLSVASCKQEKSVEASAQRATENSSKEALASEPGTAVDPGSSGAAMPDAKAVLFEIYKEKIEEISGSQLSDGRYVSYWHGQTFSHVGKNYFVAFTEATPASEIEYPAQEDKVTIAQATYEFIDKQWQLKKVQHDIGQFGSLNKAPMADPEAKAVSFSGAKEKFILAVPTFQTAIAGTRLSAQAIFSFSQADFSWKYLGQFDTGSDNGAGCAREPESTSPIKCAKSTAALHFSNDGNSDLPSIEVHMSGTAIDENGKVINLTEKDRVRYRFDSKSSSYKKATQ